MDKQPYIIGITGGSASGKSSFVKKLKAQFNDDEMSVLCTDNYYLSIDKVPVDENGVQNFDTPDAIDHALFIEHVKSLKAGNTIQKLEYNFHMSTAVPRMLTFKPAPIIVLEGIFCLHFDEIKDIADLKLYIDADATARFNRRIKRDFEERGVDLADVEYRWNNHIVPCFDDHHSEYKKAANIIIQNHVSYMPGLNIITAFLKSRLAGN